MQELLNDSLDDETNNKQIGPSIVTENYIVVLKCLSHCFLHYLGTRSTFAGDNNHATNKV